MPASKAKSKKSRPRWKVLAYCAAILGFAVWFHASGFRTAVDLRDGWRQRSAAQAEIETLMKRNAELEAEIEQLDESGVGVERLAREKLGMAREGEVVIRIPQKK
jgi:cell division protein FtsB